MSGATQGAGLFERQIGIVHAFQEQVSITDADLQRECGISTRPATEDLAALDARRIIERKGKTGRGSQLRVERGRRGRKGADEGSVIGRQPVC
jgi:predicted HTH transcriptional regulator